MLSVKLLLILSSIFLKCSSQSLDSNTILSLPETYSLDSVPKLIPNKISGSSCNRPCVAGKSRICYNKFHAEHYQSMGAACGLCQFGNKTDCFKPQCVTTDGFEKNVITFNRQIPGPLIEACVGDVIVVDLVNLLHSDTISIHWHGILQRGTPYMDGVPFITQCPISPRSNFRYTFLADEEGTFFYHSHSGLQRFNGAFGGLTIRSPPKQSNALLYDKDEHSVIFTDWIHTAPELFSVGLPTRKPKLFPEGLLINGKGRFFSDKEGTDTPQEIFYVKRKTKYRFRMVNAGSTVCPVEIQIQNHSMTVIATDGNDVQPTLFNTLVIASGERYDIIINANQTSGVFWIHAKLIGLCNSLFIYQTAFLVYGSPLPNNGRPSSPPIPSYLGYPRGITLNDPNVLCTSSSSNICISNLTCSECSLYDLNKKPDHKLYWTFAIKDMNTDKFFKKNEYTPFLNIIAPDGISLGTMNNFSLSLPPSPIMSQPSNLNQSTVCGTDGKPSYCDNMEICTCTQIVNVGKNSLVEIVLIDENPFADLPVFHPIHIHGFKFAVVSQGKFETNGTSLTVDQIKKYESQGLLKGYNKNPPVKDTVSVQTQGYVVIRFIADNPGSWMVHCHIEDHVIFGMALVLQVSGNVPPVPKNFPTCGNFV